MSSTRGLELAARIGDVLLKKHHFKPLADQKYIDGPEVRPHVRRVVRKLRPETLGVIACAAPAGVILRLYSLSTEDDGRSLLRTIVVEIILQELLKRLQLSLRVVDLDDQELRSRLDEAM
jgi:alkanesulfonate monooxygenase SsuD/methylene tetrahydromethanopterin reductase-like flavin-dependent oxidoreductase (luciferase family)